MTLLELISAVSFRDPVTITHDEDDILVDCCKDVEKLKNSEHFQQIAGKTVRSLGVGILCDLIIQIE